jgi:hypothetical protein
MLIALIRQSHKYRDRIMGNPSVNNIQVKLPHRLGEREGERKGEREGDNIIQINMPHEQSSLSLSFPSIHALSLSLEQYSNQHDPPQLGSPHPSP